jgi:hypothetical protein
MEKDFYKVEIKINKSMDSEKARDALQRAVYDATVVFYETIGEGGRLTDGKRLIGNGHHMAQNMAEQACKLWDERLK